MKLLCEFAWNTYALLALVPTLIIGLLFLFGAARTAGRMRGAAVCVACIAVALFQIWFSETARCLSGRLARGQISADYAPPPFTCEPPAKTLRGVSQDRAREALDRCDEDRWDTVWTGHDAWGAKHTILRCRAAPGVEVWADHFRHWNGLKDQDVCFSACRTGACSPKTVRVESSE